MQIEHGRVEGCGYAGCLSHCEGEAQNGSCQQSVPLHNRWNNSNLRAGRWTRMEVMFNISCVAAACHSQHGRWCPMCTLEAQLCCWFIAGEHTQGEVQFCDINHQMNLGFSVIATKPVPDTL